MATFVTCLWAGADFSMRHRASHEVPRYTLEHVAVLARMLHRHGRHRLICAIGPGVVPSRYEFDEFSPECPVLFHTMPAEVAALPGYFPKLWTWSRVFGTLVGERFCLIDLDVVILGDLGPLVQPDRVVPKPPDVVLFDFAKGELYNTSLVIMEPGARAEVWESFSVAMAENLRWTIAHKNHQFLQRFTGDQTWVAHVLGPGEATVGERDGIWNYRPSLHGKAPPEGAKAVFLCGPYDPAVEAKRVPWIAENYR